ncbi:hypothetical protein C2S52_008462 [Perilla frutescens var. hirtella]|nr:hypothetical protein C2S51_017816 [Perilla frutescens var. frutescens]KAH6783503.1 hypothetical protein C2S52_008462 [Perilla frutescens var. hirtella]
MSLSKRKRPGTEPPPLSSDDQRILDMIKSKQGSGMARTEIKFQTKIAETVVTKSIKSLLAKSLIQEVKPKNSSRKVYMGVEFTPSNEVSGGFWYLEGKLDTEFIKQLKGFCIKHLKVHKVATLEGIHKILLEGEVVKGQIPIEHIAELLNTMVLDDQILEVKSTGLGDYYRLPVGKTCYRLPAAGGGASAERSTAGAFASIPCGMCPRIALCTPDGVISPTTCVYYNKWLDVKLHN